MRCVRLAFVAVLALNGMLSTRPLAAQAAPAAPAEPTYEVRLRDGSVLYGRIAERTDSTLVVVTGSGARIVLQTIQVARITPVRADRAGRIQTPDPNPTRLLFAPTARPLAKGEGYVASYFFFLPMVAYGVTDRLVLAAGTPILPDAIGRIWYLAPKFTLAENEGASFAIGVLSFFSTEASFSNSVGILYGASTIGSTDNAVTLGAGWGYARVDGSANISNSPVILVGGERRVAPNFKVVAETYSFLDGSGSDAIWALSVRILGERISADLGVAGLTASGGCCLPVVDVVYSFGKRRE